MEELRIATTKAFPESQEHIEKLKYEYYDEQGDVIAVEDDSDIQIAI
jgi:hypothetical protein